MDDRAAWQCGRCSDATAGNAVFADAAGVDEGEADPDFAASC